MVSLAIAQQLKAAGLQWRPQQHDFFAIPDRDMDDRVFVISDMSVLVEVLQGWPAITFNGTAEWALDYILTMDVVWLPTDEQLVQVLGQAFIGLRRQEEQFTCTTQWGNERHQSAAATPSDAYAQALLAILGQGSQ